MISDICSRSKRVKRTTESKVMAQNVMPCHFGASLTACREWVHFDGKCRGLCSDKPQLNGYQSNRLHQGNSPERDQRSNITLLGASERNVPKIVIFGESQKQGFFHKSAHNSKFEGEHTHLSAYRLVLRTLWVNFIGVTYPQLAASRRDFGLKFVDFSDIKKRPDVD